MTFIVTPQRAQKVHDMARARAGLPYAYGGAFTTNPTASTDCSGLVLQTGAWYAGRSDWPGNRYGSTESFRLGHKIVYDLGFKKLPAGGVAALPIKPVMLVGLQHGGGGIYSHTACTLMTMDVPGGPVKMSERGVDWESRGGNPGVRLYHGARAWNDALFHDFWYLDAELGDTMFDPAPSDEDGVLLGVNYENGGDRVLALQKHLNAHYPVYSRLIEDGEYGTATDQVVREFQQRAGLEVDGIAGPATLAALGLSFQPQQVPDGVRVPKPVGPADDQLTLRWNMLGGKTLVEAVAEIRDKVCGTSDAGKPGVK